MVNELAAGAFHAQQRNVVLIGSIEAGETHLAIGIARSRIRDGANGRIFDIVDLVDKREPPVNANVY